MKRRLMVYTLPALLLIAMQLGLTDWLIDKGIYDPNAPHGTPTTSQQAPPQPCPAPTP